MRVMLPRHFAATAIALAVSGGAFAQSSVSPPLKSETTGTVAPSTAPETQPADLQQAPLATNLQGTDAAVAEKLRDLLAKSGRGVDRKQDRAGVETFYRNRGFAPLWTADGAASDRAKSVTAFLRGVGADGLDPADYPAPAFGGDADKLAQEELALTNSVLNFARHARTGRVSFSRVSGAIYYDLEFPDSADVLTGMANANDVGAALDAYYPQHAGYKALKAKLADARQKKNAQLADTLIANMERWRWMPRELGKAHVMVNIPDFTLKVVNQGKTAWTTRIVVGKVGEQATPLLSETMKFITVNPTWNVPPSIIRNEYLPALQRDPGALARIGLKVAHRKDGSLHVYQPPGERNALGRVRFNFPNKFLVYQHDTPQKHLFAKQTRAYSHGCMRVQHPEQYAEVLLSISQPGERYTAERIRSMYGNSERTINLKTPLPVHLTYQTAFVDDAGHLQTRPDLYGHDKKILSLLRNSQGSDTPVARNYNSSSKPVAARLPRSEESRRSENYFDRRSDRLARRSERLSYTPPGYIGPPGRRFYGTPF
jgi:murein L,D-transpeptidase YcbB/YkuD